MRKYDYTKCLDTHTDYILLLFKLISDIKTK